MAINTFSEKVRSKVSSFARYKGLDFVGSSIVNGIGHISLSLAGKATTSPKLKEEMVEFIPEIFDECEEIALST